MKDIFGSSGIQRAASTKDCSRSVVRKSKVKKVAVTHVSFTVNNKKETKEERAAKLKKQYRQIERQKFLDSMKTHCRCDHIKSIGNGL